MIITVFLQVRNEVLSVGNFDELGVGRSGLIKKLLYIREDIKQFWDRVTITAIYCRFISADLEGYKGVWDIKQTMQTIGGSQEECCDVYRKTGFLCQNNSCTSLN